MFTGLIEEAGIVESISRGGAGILALSVRSSVCGKDLRKGDSLAVNGCCLTVVKIRRQKKQWILQMDLLKETWQRTSFSQLAVGSRVNLERALPVGGRLGGHFVTGHVDGIGKIRKFEKQGQDYVLEIDAPASVIPFLIYKGSIAVDGISLTVAVVKGRRFRVWIIPHTFEVTNLREWKVGEWVNLEADLLGKYVRRLMSLR